MDSYLTLKENGKGTAQNNNKLEEPLRSMKGIVRGDHLAVKRLGHLHHVLAIEDITDPNKKSIEVIEYKHTLARKVVKSEFSVKKKDLWFRIEDISHKSSDAIDRAVKKAEAQIGFKSYSQTCENTCENFVYWCLSETIYRQPVSNMCNIKRGDHIIQCGVFDRHMLAYEDGSPDRPLEVIRFSSEKVNRSEISLNPSKQSILRVTYPENCMIDGIFSDANIVLRKAESQISFTKYSSERNNDEHFVNWCKTETGHRERVNKMSEIKPGDHIIYIGALSIIYHYLAVENGKDSWDTVRVIQYKVNKVVEEDVKLSTNGGRLYRFVDDDDDLIQHDVVEIISQAKRQLGEKRYCDEANDNEHFVYWCKTRAEHRERISNIRQLRDGDHLIIEKYRGLKEHHSLVVENEFREMEIIYYDSIKVSKDRLCVDPSKQYVYRSYRNPYDTVLLRKEQFGQKARGEIGKSFYCIGNNENKHFVKWCMVNTEIIEEVNKIDEIFTDDLFILFNRSKDEKKLYMASGNGHRNKIDAINMSQDVQSQSTNQTVSVSLNPEDQIFRILHCFEESPTSDMRYNLENNMNNGQSLYGSMFVEMMHLMRPDPDRVKCVKTVADIRKADHLMHCRFGGLYYHHLLAVENGSCGRKIKVIHFSKSRAAREVRIKIKEEEVEINGKTGHYFVVRYDVCDDPDTVIKRARQRIGETGYSLESNNCEHFVTKCKIGSRQCDQLNYGGRRVLAALAERSIDVFKQQFLGAPLKTSAGVVAEAAILRILIKAAARGLNPTSTGIRTVAASSSIAAGVAVLSEGAFLAHDAIKVERKLNQVRNTHQEKHDIYTRQWQMGGAFVGGIGGTVGGGVIGQILIPVPVLGFAVGGIVGGFVGRLAAIGAGTGIGHVAYKPNGIDVYMDFLRSVRRNRILHQ